MLEAALHCACVQTQLQSLGAVHGAQQARAVPELLAVLGDVMCAASAQVCGTAEQAQNNSHDAAEHAGFAQGAMSMVRGMNDDSQGFIA